MPMTVRPRPATMRAATPDFARQVSVTAGMILCLLGALIGMGFLGGTPQDMAADGDLAPEAALLNPSRSAFSIWSVIYLGLIAATVYQWLPGAARAARHRRTGWWIAASLILNFLWIMAAQANALVTGAVIMIALVIMLWFALDELTYYRPSVWWERLAVDAGLGLYLGWIVVAAGANIWAAAKRLGLDEAPELQTQMAAIGLLLLVLGTGFYLNSRMRGRLTIAAAIAWGTFWIAHARALGTPRDYVVALVAASVSALVLFGGIAAAMYYRRRRKEDRPRRASAVR